jgi:hypothetical protein
MTPTQDRYDDPDIPTLTVRVPAYHQATTDLAEPSSNPLTPASNDPSYPEAVLRAALQAAIEDAVDDALDEAIAHLRARLQARLPTIVAQVLRQTRPG